MGNAGLLAPELACCNSAGGDNALGDCQVVVQREKVGVQQPVSRVEGIGLSCMTVGHCVDGALCNDGEPLRTDNVYWSGPGRNAGEVGSYSGGTGPSKKRPGEFRPMKVCSSGELEETDNNYRIDPWTRYAQDGKPVRAPSTYLADTFEDGVIVCDQDSQCAGHIHLSEDAFTERVARRPPSRHRQEWRVAESRSRRSREPEAEPVPGGTRVHHGQPTTQGLHPEYVDEEIDGEMLHGERAQGLRPIFDGDLYLQPYEHRRQEPASHRQPVCQIVNVHNMQADGLLQTREDARPATARADERPTVECTALLEDVAPTPVGLL